MTSRMSQRRELIKAIQTKRDGKVVCYVTTVRQGLRAPVRSENLPHVRDLALATWAGERDQRLDLVLITAGGEGDVPWALMSNLRQIIGRDAELNVLVPSTCLSAGTIATLGADTIVMTRLGHLGPIDTTMRTPYCPLHEVTREPLPISVEDVMGYFSFLDTIGCTGPEEKVEGLKEFTRKVHPYALGQVQRLLDQTRRVARLLLKSRRKPFTDAENEAIVETLARKIPSHGHAIFRTEARDDVGLAHVVFSEEAKIDAELTDLLSEYERLLHMRALWAPHDELYTSDEETLEKSSVPLVAVESENGGEWALVDYRFHRIRQEPPNVQIPLPPVSLPSVNLPAGVLPPNAPPQAVQQLVAQLLQGMLPGVFQQAIQQAIAAHRKSLPTIGVRGEEHNYRWDTIT